VLGLRASLVLFSLVTVLLAAAAVHLPWRWISRENTADLAEQINQQIVKGLTAEIDGIFSNAAAAQETLRDILEGGLVNIEDDRARETLFFAFLESNPQFSWVSVGRPNGDLYGVQRRDNTYLRAEKSVWDPVARKATRRIDYYVYMSDAEHYFQTKREVNDYYAPDRDWYKQALAAAGPVWTDVYTFATSGKPGVNTAIKLVKDGQVFGCLTVAIALERVDAYLARIDVARRGAVFITDDKGRMIALRDLDSGVEAGLKDTWVLQPFASVDHPLLRLAGTAMGEAGIKLAAIGPHRQMLVSDPESGQNYFLSLAAVGDKGWVLGTVLPLSEFMTGIDQNAHKLALALLVAIGVVALFAVSVAGLLFVRPLRRIAVEMTEVGQFQLARISRVGSRIREIDALGQGVLQMTHSLASFQKFLPTELVRSLLARGIVAELGGEKRTLSVMFLDLEGFTTISERHGHRLLPQLGEFFGEMSQQVMRTGGTIDKYVGDCIMAFWGAPAHNDAHAVDACRGALACLRRLDELRAEWRRQGKPDLPARIGINTGRVIVGNIGSGERLNYTVIGDPVNLASRLESLNRNYGTSLVVSQHTYEHAKYEFVFRRLDTVQVRGRDEAVKIYEVVAELAGEVDEAAYPWIRAYERGLALFEARDWLAARDQFREAIALRGGDPPSAAFILRCEQHLVPDAARPEGARPEGARPEGARPEPVRPEPVRIVASSDHVAAE
jgi:adenylate cyclase